MNTISQKPLSRVKGKTVIDHYIRTMLWMTCDEYTIMDFIYNSKDLTSDELYIQTGYTKVSFQPLSKSLVEKELLKYENNKWKTTDLWNKWFTINEADFDELWKIYHVGNKTEAKEVYLRARKIATAEDIMKGAVAYLRYKEFKEQYLEHTRTWLNPKYKKWNDDYSLPSDKPQTTHPDTKEESKIHP